MQVLRILLIYIVQLCFAISTNAADGSSTGTDKFTVGIESGAGISWLHNQQLYIGGAAAINAGANFRYHINKTFSVGAGLWYNRMDIRQARSYLGPDAYLVDVVPFLNVYHLNYLTLPVVARAVFGRKVKFFVEAGGYISVLPTRVIISMEPPYPYSPPYEYIPTPVHRIDAGLTANMGLEIPLPKYFGITIEERNNIGLTKIISNLHNYSSVLLVGGTYSFGSKK